MGGSLRLWACVALIRDRLACAQPPQRQRNYLVVLFTKGRINTVCVFLRVFSYVISHDETNSEESIGVFQIVAPATGRIPSLTFVYALTSANWPWYGHGNFWFLNDVATAARSDGTQDLYASQFGPFGLATDKFYLFHCTWDENDVKPNGRLAASCSAVASKAITYQPPI